MSLIILIPGLLCILALVRGTTQRAFLDVVLPALMVLPMYFVWKVALLPPMVFIETAMVPLGVGMFLTNLGEWRFSRTDLWMGVFLISAGYADYRAGQTTASIFGIFQMVAEGLAPYLAGKLLIEQSGARVETVRRFVWLLFIVCVPSMCEYFVKVNPVIYFWSHIFYQSSGWHTQLRWGFGRVAGPYAQSELAGIVIFTGILLTLWLAAWGHWEPRCKYLPSLPIGKATIITATLVV